MRKQFLTDVTGNIKHVDFLLAYKWALDEHIGHGRIKAFVGCLISWHIPQHESTNECWRCLVFKIFGFLRTSLLLHLRVKTTISGIRLKNVNQISGILCEVAEMNLGGGKLLDDPLIEGLTFVPACPDFMLPNRF